SEDLDFDNQGLSQSDFKDLGKLIKDKLTLEGYKIETKTVFKKAHRLYLTFHNVLYTNKISPHKDAVLLIRVDAQPQNFKYETSKAIINKFDIFSQILAVPIDILLSQKISCLFSRPRLMGRDFYDIIFLLGKTKPNLNYLKAKLKIKDKTELKEKLLKKCQGLDYKQLSKDIEAFLFSPGEKKKVLLFYDYLKEISL
ncbi:MAG: nucleotidyl transferase AbiEii/AbiGii toxin family protein, partial [Candidatus Margulisbacteria bacterium]|nr:nucleotidyl transferase AbiEii/AbiGii toxin family protein [Candidatus Margulisiibacteriota bacterium]